ncbi:MAG: 2-C-methyl-D-erythritol 2,4-cyclodiphosphate synthase [Thermaerobacterales bacterium]
MHAFSDQPERRLVIGGVGFPAERGLAGHSDADVLVHAVIDALLGAAALGDIGTHFPDTDPDYQDADSIDLLRQARLMVSARGAQISNVDTTVVAEQPRLADRIPAMRRSLAAALDIPEHRVSVKATTSEGLGFIGAVQGIAAHAVCLLAFPAP